MKKIVSFLSVVFIMTLMAGSADAKTYTDKESAVKSIEESLKDPEIKTWVNNKYGSEKTFLKAAKFASVEQVTAIASSFDDFKENGGDITFKDEEIKWIIVAFGFLLVLVILF